MQLPKGNFLKSPGEMVQPGPVLSEPGPPADKDPNGGHRQVILQ